MFCVVFYLCLPNGEVVQEKFGECSLLSMVYQELRSPITCLFLPSRCQIAQLECPRYGMVTVCCTCKETVVLKDKIWVNLALV